MRLEDIDKNFRVDANKIPPEVEWHDPRNAPFGLYGVFYDEKRERYQRLPYELAEQVGEGVAYLSKNTAGGRIRFVTDSPYVSIYYKMPIHTTDSHITKLGKSGFDLYRKTKNDTQLTYFRSFRPPNEPAEQGVLTQNAAGTEGQMVEYTINLPLYDDVNELYIGLKKGSKIEAPAPYRFEKPVVFYGSSITQGGCASRPGNAYQGFISRDYNIDYINLGFSGSARGEQAMAEYIAGLKMQAFVCDYDHNAPNPEHLQATLEPFYRTIRAKHPKLPIIFVSKPDTNRPMATCTKIIHDVYEKAKQAGENVYFIDGYELFEGDHRDACTVDGCHPNDLGFLRMANRIGAELKKALNL